MYEENQYQDPEQPVRKSSPAKAAVAQQKPRDNKGKFLSGAELQQYQQQRQAQQLSAERERMNQLLGNRGSPVQGQQTLTQPTQGIPEDKFRNILRANGAQGGRTLNQGTAENQAGDKWDVLLGKKKSNIRW